MSNFFKKLTTISLVLLMSFTSLNIPAKVYAEDISESTQEHDHEHDNNETTEENVELFSSFELDVSPSEQDGFLYIQDVAVVSIRSLNEYPSDFIEEVILINDFEDSDLLIQDSFLDSQTKFSVKENVYAFDILNNSEYSNDSFAISLRFDNPFLSFSEEELEEKQEEIKQYYDDFESRFQDSKLFLINKDNEVKQLEYQFFKDNLIISFNSSEIGRFFFVKLEEILPEPEEIEVEQFEEKKFSVYDPNLQLEENEILLEDTLVETTLVSMPEIIDENFHLEVPSVETFSVDLLGSALPQDIQPSTLPITVDGVSIEKASMRWLSKSTGSNEPAKFNDLVLVPTGNIATNQQWQLDFSLSGKGTIDVGDLEIVIPAYIWKDRNGNEPGRLTLAIPEEPAHNGDFAWKRVDDTYVITNVRRISAGSKYMIQGTFRMTYPDPNSDKPFTSTPTYLMNDINTIDPNAEYKGVSDWLYANIMILTPTHQEELSATTNLIRATIDTKVEATVAEKKVTEGDIFIKNVPINIPSDLLPDNPEDYYYVRWYIAGEANGNQPYTMKLVDNLTDEHNGILLGFESGDNQVVNAREGSVDIYQGYSFNSVKSTRVWTAYPKSAFPNEDTIYTVTNDLTVEVRGVDDEVLSTKTTSASARIRKPATYHINKVWEYNADKYETDLETIMSRRPSSVRVSLSGVSFSDYLSESNNWHTEYVDSGTGAKPTDAYESLNPSGVISSERIYYPDGSYSVRESRWSYVLRKKDYDAQTKTWTFYNEYVETSGVRYYRYFTSESRKYATNHTDSYVRSLTDKDLVFLRNSQETTDITYNVHRSLSTINYTAKNTLNFYSDDNLHQNTVRLEIEDHSEYLNEVKLNENDYYFVYATLPNPNAYFWSGSDRIFSSANKIAAEMYGKVSSEWIKFAEIDENGQITPFNEATINDNKVVFPGTNVLQTKLVTRTNGDWLSAGYNVGLRIKPSESVVQQVEDEFSLSDYVMMNSRNEVSFKLYDDSTDALLNTTNNSAVTYLHGRNYRLAVDLDKTTAYIKNDRSNRQLVWKNTITLNRVSTIPNLPEFNYAVSENMFSDSKSGVFYDLLPAGMRVDESSIRPVSNVNIKNVNIIENYKDSGRQLLIIEADLNNVASVINVATNSNKYNDETHPCYRNQTVYGWAPSVVSFEMTYSYDEAKNRGLTDLRNHAAYVADEQAFGDVKYWSGENDVPNGQNHKETLGEVREDARELMTDLSESNSPNTVYAGAILTLSEVDFSALTNIVKQVSITGSDAWSYGFDNEVNVSEGGKYSYRITLTSGTDTTTKDIIILDSLENYTPIKVTDSGDSTIPVGRVISQREFNETNELIEINGGNLIQGEPAWAWQGYFRGIDISEITSLGVDAKVYYSTVENLDITAYNPDSETGIVPEVLLDTSVWSLTPPADPSRVTAIAIDCRKKEGGADFELKSDESLIAYVHMKAPTYSQAPDAFGEDYKDFLQNAHAFNNVFMDVTQIDDLGLTTHSYDHFDFTQVGIYGMDVKVKKIWDDQNDNDRVRPEEIEVELLANNESTGKKLTLNSQGNWEGIFDHVLEFDDNDNRINYSIAESVEEYTPSIKKEITGNLTTITVTNKHELFKTDYPFTKVWVSEEAAGWQTNIPSSITVRLLADGVFTGKTQIVRPDSSGNWSGVFTNLQKKKDGVDIEYSVEEVPLSSDWITEYEGNQIKNTYYPYGDLIVKKQVINSTPESKDNLFKFTISLKDKNNEYLIDEYNYTIFNENNEEISTGTIKNGDEFELKENWLIEIKDIPSGSRYELSEENKAGYILSSKTNFSNTINAAVPQESVFTNTYNTTGSISITGNKTLTGRDITRNQFRFEIYDAEDKLIRTAGNTAEGLINFGSFTYGVNDNGKEFVYTVKEVDRGRPGYTYDDSVYTVKVYPVDNGDGTMTVTQNTFKNDVEAQSIDFANEYHAEGEITLRAWKELEVRKLQNEEFEFELIDEENNVVDTKKNSADGSIVFDTLRFDETDIGKTYYYAVREKLGDDPTVNYDRSVFGYALTVLDNGNGTLSISQGTATPIFGEPEEDQSEYFAKYAVSIWGIGQDTLEDGSTAGLTFGPAIGVNYINSFKSHTPSGSTTSGNAHRCVHGDDWNTIIHWNNVDPYVYEQCVAENCTHSVKLHEAGDTIVNPNFETSGLGDGPSALYDELLQYDGSTKIYENLRWHPNNNMPNNASTSGTNYGGWGASRIRAMLNGADSLTDIGDGTASKPGGTDIYGGGGSSDIHKSASIYTSTNNLLACFPQELQAAIGKRATKYDSVYNSKTEANLRTSYDKLWLLSPNEMSNSISDTYCNHPLEAPNGKYQKFVENNLNLSASSNAAFRAFRLGSGTAIYGTADAWWLRSSHESFAYSALYAALYGGVWYGPTTNYVCCVSPAFALDRSITPVISEQLPPIIGWETEDAELPIFRNTIKDGSLTISKLVENEENANPDQEFKFKIKLIGPGIENQQFEWNKEKLPYNAYLVYDANGGEFGDGATENKLTYLVNNNVSSLTNGEYEEPIREGYIFDGWYEDVEFTQEFTGNPEELSLLEDKKVYAKWERTEAYTVYDSSNETITFFRDAPGKYTNNQVDGTKTYYTEIETKDYADRLPWYKYNSYRTFILEDEISPISTESWFAYSTEIIGLDKLDTSNVTNMCAMFAGSSIASLDLSLLDTSNVTSMVSMFAYYQSTSLDLSSFDTSNVKHMDSMFRGSQVTSLDLSSFDTSNVTSMQRMFENSKATTLDLSSFNTSIVTDVRYMFRDSQATTIYVSNLWNVNNVTNTDGMFTGCTNLPNFNSSYVDKTRAHYGEGGYLTYKPAPTLSLNNSNNLLATDNEHYKNYSDKILNWFDNFSFFTTVHAEDTEITFTNGEAEVTLKKNEKITFNNIPAGTAYQVWEETSDGWVLIEQRNTSGEIMPLETSEAEFKNRYQPGTTSVQFNGTKLLDNIAAEEGSFSFELYEGEELLETVSVLDGGFIQFSVLSYTEAGAHNYTIKEVNPNSDTVDFDTHIENITVVVKDNGGGTLSSEVTYDEDGIVFRNNTRPGTLEIKKNVDISTNANKDDVFTFEIELTNENGVPLSSDENIYWYRKDANGNIIDDVDLLGRVQAFFTGRDTKLNSSPIEQEGFDNENNINNEENTSAVNEEDLLEKLGLVKRVYAEEGDIASGVYDGVDWRITAGGELIIGKEGEVQEFTYMINRYYNPYPWYSRRNSINSIRFVGTVKGNGSMQTMFASSQAASIDLSGFDTSNVTNMRSMFASSQAASIDLSGFDTSNVTDMSYMFNSSQATSIIFPENFGSAATNMYGMFLRSQVASLDLSNFNTSNVSDMVYMFGDSKVTSLDLSSFDTSNVTDMCGMFYKTKVTSLDLSSFNTSNVTSMQRMFYESQATSIDLSSFDTSNVTNMEAMFYQSQATSLDLSSFNTSNVTDMEQMFRGSQTTSIIFPENFGSAATNMSNMFRESRATTIKGLESFNTSNVTNMSNMFYDSQATTLDLSSFDTSNITNMSWLFGYSKATTINLSSFDTSNVTDMSDMFYHSQATSIIFPENFGSAATDMSWMFGSFKAAPLDLSNFNTSNVTTMNSMFAGSEIISIIFPENFGSAATNMSSMFYNAKATTLDLSSFNISNVTSMGSMFNNFKATALDLSSFDTSKVTFASSMFYNNNIEEINIGENFFSSSEINFPERISSNNYYTEKWIKSDSSFGPYTPSEIKQYFTEDMAGSWIRVVSHINFDANGGYILPEYQTVYSDKSLDGVLVPSENAVQRPYYKFKGWSTTFPETNIDYQPGSVAPNSYAKDSPTLYAVWEYDGKNQINVNHLQESIGGEDYNLAETEVIRDIPGVEYSPNLKSYPGFHAISSVEAIPVSDDGLTTVNYYYDRDRYTVNFDGNGSASGQMLEVSNFIGGVPSALPKNTFSKKGAIFTSWNTQPDGFGTTYLDQAEILNIGNHGETVTLYAQWNTNDTSIIPSNGKILVQCKAGETIVIPDLPYGTKYIIKEVNLPEGWSFNSSMGEIGSVGANTVSSSQFNNKYSAESLAFITAHKTIIGDTPQEGQFTFELYQGNTLLQSKTNGIIDINEEIPGNNDENIPNPWLNTAPVEFDALQFTQEDIGKTFTYTIKEVNTGDNRINYDTHTETVRITVNDAGNGNLDCNVVYDSDGALFTNSLKSSGLQLKKNIVNSTQISEETEFNFTIDLKDSAGNPISGKFPVKIKHKNYEIYDVDIPDSLYSHTSNVDDTGKQIGNYGNYLNTNEVISIPNATNLIVDVYYNGESVTFDWLSVWKGSYPAYKASSYATYTGYVTTNDGAPNDTNKFGGSQSGSYTVNGNSLTNVGYMRLTIPGNSVTFGFKSDFGGVGKGYGYYAIITPLDENGNPFTRTIQEEQGFSETTISDGGTLTLKGGEELEITGLPDGATYEIVELDSPGWEITNKAGETGQIVAGETTFAEFENTYSTSGKVILSGNKILYGSSLENESFEFELKDENDNVLQTATSDPQGNFSFEIDYSQEDDGNTLYYHITEKIDEERENIKWDEHIAEVSVKIEDNGHGELIPTVTLNEEDMTFTNVFYNSIEVSKLVTGEFGDKSKEFNFTLKLSENWDKNEITWTKGEETGIVDSNNFRFTLSHDDSITFEGITSNIEYEVVENDSFKNGYSSKVEGDMESSSVNPLNMELSAKGNLDSDKSITFTNDARGVIPTEIRLRDGIFALSAILIAAIFFVARRRKKYAS